MNLKSTVGWILSSLVASTALLSIAGVWGWLQPEVAVQIISTFFIVGLSALGISYMTSIFFK